MFQYPVEASPAVRQTFEIPLDIPDVTIENVTTNRMGHIEITVKSALSSVWHDDHPSVW
jgi:hypothetical protein